ncbi:MAG: hypothetical protein AB1797_09685 [bacterium]
MATVRLGLVWLNKFWERLVGGKERRYKIPQRTEYVLFPAICGDDFSTPGKDCMGCRKCL